MTDSAREADEESDRVVGAGRSHVVDLVGQRRVGRADHGSDGEAALPCRLADGEAVVPDPARAGVAVDLDVDVAGPGRREVDGAVVRTVGGVATRRGGSGDRHRPGVVTPDRARAVVPGDDRQVRRVRAEGAEARERGVERHVERATDTGGRRDGGATAEATVVAVAGRVAGLVRHLAARAGAAPADVIGVRRAEGRSAAGADVVAVAAVEAGASAVAGLVRDVPRTADARAARVVLVRIARDGRTTSAVAAVETGASAVALLVRELSARTRAGPTDVVLVRVARTAGRDVRAEARASRSLRVALQVRDVPDAARTRTTDAEVLVRRASTAGAATEALAHGPAQAVVGAGLRRGLAHGARGDAGALLVRNAHGRRRARTALAGAVAIAGAVALLLGGEARGAGGARVGRDAVRDARDRGGRRSDALARRPREAVVGAGLLGQLTRSARRHAITLRRRDAHGRRRARRALAGAVGAAGAVALLLGGEARGAGGARVHRDRVRHANVRARRLIDAAAIGPLAVDA